MNFWVTTSPRYASSSAGTPSLPAEPPSLSQAALIGPRTTRAPVSGVQKMTGLSAALNVVLRLPGARPAPSSMVGKPRSLLAAPPSASYFSRMAPFMMWAPTAGVKKILPPAKFCPKPSPAGYTPPSRGPSEPVSPPLASHAAVIAASASDSGVANATGASRSIAAPASRPMATRPITVLRSRRLPAHSPSQRSAQNSLKNTAPVDSASLGVNYQDHRRS